MHTFRKTTPPKKQEKEELSVRKKNLRRVPKLLRSELQQEVHKTTKRHDVPSV